MSFTTKQVYEAYNQSIDEYQNNPVVNERNEAYNEVLLDYEDAALSAHSSIVTKEERTECSSTNLNINTLKSDMGEQYYSYDAAKSIGCVVSSIYYTLLEDHGNLAHLADIKHEIRGLKKIGDPSVSGNAIAGGIGDAKDLYVIKTPQTREGTTDLLHELFVGIFGINSLRKSVPNFAMIYYGAKGPMPSIVDGKVKIPDDLGNGVQYVIYENIANSQPMSKYITNGTAKEFLSVFMQFLYSLDYAAAAIGFTHYDAHTGNVLARPVEGLNTFSIPYLDPVTQRTVYVTSNVISTVIDYGRTSIKYKGIDYGCSDNDLSQFGVKAGVNPLYDVYKYLMFIGYDFLRRNSNSPVIDEAARIFSYFNDKEDYLYCVEKQRDTFYCFLPSASNANMTLRGLIAHVHAVCDLSGVVTKKPLYTVLDCSSKGSCIAFQGLLKEARLSKEPPKTILEFYDVASSTKNKSKYEELVAGFDYNGAKKEFKRSLEHEMNLFSSYINSEQLRRIPALGKVTALTLRDRAIYEALESGFNYLLSAVSSYETIELWFKVAEAVATVFQDQNFANYVNVGRDKLRSYNASLMKSVEVVRRNYSQMRSIIEEDLWLELYHQKYPWYRDSSSTIVGLVNRFKRDEEDLFTPLMLPSVMLPSSRAETKQATAPKKSEPMTLSVLPSNRKTKLVRTTEGMPVRVDCSVCR